MCSTNLAVGIYRSQSQISYNLWESCGVDCMSRRTHWADPRTKRVLLVVFNYAVKIIISFFQLFSTSLTYRTVGNYNYSPQCSQSYQIDFLQANHQSSPTNLPSSKPTMSDLLKAVASRQFRWYYKWTSLGPDGIPDCTIKDGLKQPNRIKISSLQTVQSTLPV